MLSMLSKLSLLSTLSTLCMMSGFVQLTFWNEILRVLEVEILDSDTRLADRQGPHRQGSQYANVHLCGPLRVSEHVMRGKGENVSNVIREGTRSFYQNKSFYNY